MACELPSGTHGKPPPTHPEPPAAIKLIDPGPAVTDWPSYSYDRERTGWNRGDYWFPDLGSAGGVALLFTLVLYPYVYLAARSAFLAAAGRREAAWSRQAERHLLT